MKFNIWITTVMAATTMLLGVQAMALTLKPSTLNLAAGASSTVKVNGVSGKLRWVNSAPAVVIVSQVDNSTFKISAVIAGQAVVSFKDSRDSAKTTVTVQPAAGSASALSGRLLASNCFQCHGTNGNGGFERLSGKSAREIYSELKQFANGSEDPGSLMAAHASGFSDAQLNAIANYLSTVR